MQLAFINAIDASLESEEFDLSEFLHLLALDYKLNPGARNNSNGNPLRVVERLFPHDRSRSIIDRMAARQTHLRYVQLSIQMVTYPEADHSYCLNEMIYVARKNQFVFSLLATLAYIPSLPKEFKQKVMIVFQEMVIWVANGGAKTNGSEVLSPKE